MDLGLCEDKLKQNDNISYNNQLYILQIISEEIGMKIPKIEYEIYINKESQDIIKNEYSFGSQAVKFNNVKIIWNIKKINSTDSMFNDCNKIIEINLSKFDTSEVTSMANMFYKCSSLISLDLTNFNLSHVSVMASMFSECTSLISLDLSNFDAS